MTRDTLADVTIDSDDDFEAVLAEAVERAVKAGVDVRGSYAFRTGGSTHEWELQIVELANDRESYEE